MAIEPIKGFYVHDEVTDTDGVAKVSIDAVHEFVEDVSGTVEGWLDEHPEATTTVQDGAIGTDKLADEAVTLEKIKVGDLGYVTPEMFGAKADGETDDTLAIQAAIDYATENNIDTVVFPYGTYIFTSLKLYSNSVLYGLGGKLKVKDNYVTTSSGTYYIIYCEFGAENVHVVNLTIDANSENNARPTVCDTITIMGNGSSVENCTLLNTIDSAIMASEITNGKIINNYIEGFYDSGIYVNSNGDESKLDKLIISNNNIVNDTGACIGLKRITTNVIITGNTLKAGAGISFEQTTGYDFSGKSIISNNIIEAVNTFGIMLRVLGPFLVVGNKIKTAGPGLKLESCTNANISNNYIDAGGSAIYMEDRKISESEYGSNENIIITNNTIEGNYGIAMVGALSQVGIKNIVINANKIKGVTKDFYVNSAARLENINITNNLLSNESSIQAADYSTIIVNNNIGGKVWGESGNLLTALKLTNTRLVNTNGFGNAADSATYKKGDLVVNTSGTNAKIQLAIADGAGSDVLKTVTLNT